MVSREWKWNGDSAVDFCAAVATTAKDIGKGNGNGVNWFADVSGTTYQTINNAGGVSDVPEPASLVLCGGGLIACGVRKWRRNRRQRRA